MQSILSALTECLKFCDLPHFLANQELLAVALNHFAFYLNHRIVLTFYLPDIFVLIYHGSSYYEKLHPYNVLPCLVLTTSYAFRLLYLTAYIVLRDCFVLSSLMAMIGSLFNVHTASSGGKTIQPLWCNLIYIALCFLSMNLPELLMLQLNFIIQSSLNNYH